MLDVPFYYENSNGDVLQLNSNGLVADPQPLLTWSMDSTTSNNTLTGFSSDVDSFSLTVAVARGSNAMELRDSLYEIPIVDVESFVAGKIHVGSWYRYGFINSQDIEAWRDSSGMAKFTVDVTFTEDGYWRRDTTSSYNTGIETITTDGLNFPFDFPFNFGGQSSARTIENNNFTASDVLIRIYGPAENPRITIGNNTYGVDMSISTGEYLEIDTYNKTVTLYLINGETENHFADIAGEYIEDSGSYIFQSIPRGIQEVTWSRNYNFDLVIKERRKAIRYKDLA